MYDDAGAERRDRFLKEPQIITDGEFREKQ